MVIFKFPGLQIFISLRKSKNASLFYLASIKMRICESISEKADDSMILKCHKTASE